MHSPRVENYVKAIYLLAARDGENGAVSTGEVAQTLAVAPSSASCMFKLLAESGLVIHKPHERGRLTPAGERLALTILRRHRLLESFLSRTLGMSWDEVGEEADRLEHTVSDHLLERIDILLGHPQLDPHGDPIPRADRSMREPDGRPLSQLSPGERFRVVRVIEQDTSFLRYLAECGLLLDAEAELVENRPEAGALSVRVDDHAMVLGLEAAAKVLTHPPISAGDRAARRRSGTDTETVRIGG